MSKKQMVIYHLHTEYSNPQVIDSVSSMDDYIEEAKKLGMTSIGRSEHGNIYEWLKIKKKVEDAGLKYMHGAEFYVTKQLAPKVRDNYHFVLYAKNTEGKKELNRLMSIANSESHQYYNPRITLDELYNTSDNILVTTACLAGLLWKGRKDTEMVDTFLTWASNNSDRVFLEVQSHVLEDQKTYNKTLVKYSNEYDLKLIAGTDTHSLNERHQEARMLIKYSKGFVYGDEDSVDLTFYGREKAERLFKKQGVLSEEQYNTAIDNTILFSDLIGEYEVSSNFKYPELYDEPKKTLEDMTVKGYKKYKDLGVITRDNENQFKERVYEELKIFNELGMNSFMAFMGELSEWCEENDIVRSDGRGSVTGSTIAYLTDITDVNPVEHKTFFSRFCNSSRVTLGDIDLDFQDDDRPDVFNYITQRYGQDYTAKVITFGTMATRGAIDQIVRGLNNKNKIDNDTNEMLYSYDVADKIKDRLENEDESIKEEYIDIFKYYDIVLGTIIQIGIHAAGIVASPIKLDEHVGVSTIKDAKSKESIYVTNCSKKVLETHGYVKYDILGLRNVAILKSTYDLNETKYEKAHEIDWDDDNVWNEMMEHQAGVFQFTSDYAFKQLRDMKPRRIKDMSITNALLRPSGASIRSEYYNDINFDNPSEEIDEMFKDQKGYVIFQEDTIAYLQDICGLSGSDADTVRRAIGAKDHATMDKWLPKIKEGYRKKVGKTKDVAYQEVESFIKILSDSADYQFGYNHATSYSMLGYRGVRERHYNPLEFTTAFLRHSTTDEHVQLGMDLAEYKGIKINPIKFGKSKGYYFMDKDDFAIYEGTAKIKYLNSNIGDELYELSQNNTHTSFIDLLYDLSNTSMQSNQLEILIRLDFFNEFGNDKKLLTTYKIFDTFNGRKQLNKETNANLINIIKKLGVSEEYIKANTKETEKLYKNFDFKPILFKMETNIPNSEFTVKEKIGAQLEYLTYINKQYDIDVNIWVVTYISTYKNPYLDVHNIRTGKSKKLKLFKYDIAKNNGRPEIGNFIRVDKSVWQRKDVKQGDEWVRSKDKQLVLKKYFIIK